MAWDAGTISTLLSTVISTFIATIISVYITKRRIRNQDELKLYDEILQMNLLSIQYPYFENPDFCSSYSDSFSTDEFLRYDSYCCIVYNLLEKVWRHFNGDTNKINDFLGSKEIIKQHRQWWRSKRNIADNVEGYPLDFIDYIDSHSPS